MSRRSGGPLVAGVDVGGTNIQVGLVDADHAVRQRGKAPTPREGPEAVLDTIGELVDALGERPVAVGLGIPGAVHAGQVLTVPNLANWDGQFDVAAAARARLGVDVALGNDVNVGLLGEWLAGAAAGAENVLGLWLGTGVGGGLILDGRPFTGARGAAGEVGHVVVHAGGALCFCGRRGCVEAYAGRRAMEAAVERMVGAGRATSLYEIRDEVGKTALTSKVWARALEAEDPMAVEVFATGIATLGRGAASVITMTDVDTVVVGGGLAEKLGQDLADRVAAAARPFVLAPSPDLRFTAAALGDDSGVVGAAALARSAVLDPMS